MCVWHTVGLRKGSQGEGGGWKNLYILLLWEGGQTHSYVIFSKSILEIARLSGLAGIIFHLRLEGKKTY